MLKHGLDVGKVGLTFGLWEGWERCMQRRGPVSPTSMGSVAILVVLVRRRRWCGWSLVLEALLVAKGCVQVGKVRSLGRLGGGACLIFVCCYTGIGMRLELGLGGSPVVMIV